MVSEGFGLEHYARHWLFMVMLKLILNTYSSEINKDVF